jgi:channel protein (hemolysin III family)
VQLALRKLDHSAIYLLIAGTYTPNCYHFFEGFWKNYQKTAVKEKAIKR